MQLTGDVVENRLIESLTAGLPRSPRQLNGLHEADAEILDTGQPALLVVKTDAVAEEIASGLYRDPALAGWMVVMSNLSDLAAVGAEPLGVLVAAVLPPEADEAFRRALARGIGEACQRAGTFLLGGDTNQGCELVLAGAAVGTVPRGRAMLRRGARPGDAVYLTGRAGLGAAYALSRVTHPAGAPTPFRPVARLAEGRVLREHARCCMDTSDGVLHTLDTLMRINGCGFVLDGAGEEALHPLALDACRDLGAPPWLALACVHGEFELCFTVDPEREPQLRRAAAAAGFEPVRLGEVVAGSGVALRRGGGLVPLDTAAVRNVAAGAGGDPEGYLQALLALGRCAVPGGGGPA